MFAHGGSGISCVYAGGGSSAGCVFAVGGSGVGCVCWRRFWCRVCMLVYDLLLGVCMLVLSVCADEVPCVLCVCWWLIWCFVCMLVEDLVFGVSMMVEDLVQDVHADSGGGFGVECVYSYGRFDAGYSYKYKHSYGGGSCVGCVYAGGGYGVGICLLVKDLMVGVHINHVIIYIII